MAMSNSNQLPPRAKDETGNTYGRLTVLSYAGNGLKGHKGAYWKCRCECGNTETVCGRHLRRGGTKSCGCLKNTQSGGGKTPEYLIWKDIKRRCYNPRRNDYHLYGGRGIAICERWRASFVNFLEDMGPKPFPEATIDRIDNDGPYSPGNCRWASRTEQARNKRNSRLITYNGETMCMSAWARKVGITDSALHYRFKRGWSTKKALTTPAMWNAVKRRCG